MISLILRKSAKSLQVKLNEFFEHESEATVSASAYTQARASLRHTAFIELNEGGIVNECYDGGEYERYKGYRLLAVDGSKLRLPDTESIREEFGTIRIKSQHTEGRYTGAQSSVLYELREVLTHFKQSDVRSDLFSLGVILFELLTLRSPFPDRQGTSQEAIRQLINDRQQSPQRNLDSLRGVSSSVQAIVKKLLQPFPEQRYQNTSQLLEDLYSESNYQPLRHAAGESLVDRFYKWHKRHPRLSSSTMIGSLAAMLLFIAFFVVLRQQQHVQNLNSINWVEVGKQTRGVAHGLVAPTDLPEQQVQAMIEACSQSLDDFSKLATNGLSASNLAMVNSTAAELYFLRARGTVSLAIQEHEPIRIRDLLTEAARDLEYSSKLANQQQSHAAQTLVQAVNKALSESIDSPINREEFVKHLCPNADQVESAIASMKSAIVTDANNPWYWTNMAQLRLQQGDRDAAQVDLEMALQVDSDLPWPRLMLSALKLERHHYLGAMKLLDVVVEHEKSSIVGRFNRALCNIGLNNQLAALKDLNAIEEHAPKMPRILFVRELVHRRLGNSQLAEKDLQAGLALPPRDARDWVAHGEAQLRNKPASPNGALADFKQASLISPKLRNSYENIAHVYSEYLNQPAAAIEALNKAIECDDQYALAWSSRSVLSTREGDCESALTDAARALELEHTPMVCYQAASAYAIVRRDDKDEQKALQLLKETARQNPGLAEFMKKDRDLEGIQDRTLLNQIIEAAQQLK